MAQDNSRRDFIKTAGVAGAGLAFAMSSMGSAFAKANNKKVKLGFIGTGSRGRYLFENLLALENTPAFEIVALCDNYKPSLDLAASISKKYQISPKVFTDYRKMIKECEMDGVVIATPLFQHAHITIDCLHAGIHVLCEKSMARTLNDTKAMYDAHKQSGAILLVGHQRLFNPKYHFIMDKVHKGEYGHIGQMKARWHRNNNWRRPVPADQPDLERQINWRLYKEYSAGLLTELMSHHLQVANWAKQKTPISVMGTGSINHYHDGREVPDNVALIFSYDDGTQFMYDSLTMNKLEGCEIELKAEKGTLSLEMNKYRPQKPLDPIEPEQPPGIAQLIHDIQKGKFEDAPVGGASWAPEDPIKRSHVKFYAGKDDKRGNGTPEELIAFINYIQQKSAPEWMTVEGYNASIWTLLGEQAIDSGNKISCPAKYIL